MRECVVRAPNWVRGVGASNPVHYSLWLKALAPCDKQFNKIQNVRKIANVMARASIWKSRKRLPRLAVTATAAATASAAAADVHWNGNAKWFQRAKKKNCEHFHAANKDDNLASRRKIMKSSSSSSRSNKENVNSIFRRKSKFNVADK